MGHFNVFSTFLYLLLGTNFAQIVTTTEYITFQNREQLDNEGKVFLAWEFDDATGIITFEMEVETTGFVGLGISPTGGMTGADIFIAGVYPNGSSYSADRNAQCSCEPDIDEYQDWELISAIEAVGKTYLKFSRLANTCDDEDYPIGNDITRVIWAYGNTDTIQYHTTDRRGTKGLNLIGVSMPELELEGLNKWEMTLDMVMPSEDTTYWCSFYKGPIVTRKHHVVAFDSLLDGLDSIKHTHHFILKNCYLPPDSNQTLDEIFADYTVDTGFLGGRCWDPGAIVTIPDVYCGEDLFVWAKGGKIMTFPENVGYPIGDGDNVGKQLYYMIETHYDNPEELADVRFRTGVQFYYTDQTREQDAGLLAVGHMTNPVLTIPPNVDDFVIAGHCSPEATAWGIEQADGITIFNSLLHAHISGRKLKLRHFRGNVELPWIDYDDHYDFDFQQNKPIELTQILPGDQLTFECTYSSKWNNGKAVVGGLSTRHEMCSTFLWHYPRQRMDQCFSEPPFTKHLKNFGITKFEFVAVVGESVVMIEKPQYLAGNYRDTISNFNNWTAEFIEQYGFEHRYWVHEVAAYRQSTGDYLVSAASYPEDYVKYEPADVCQGTGTPTASTTDDGTTVDEGTTPDESTTPDDDTTTSAPPTSLPTTTGGPIISPVTIPTQATTTSPTGTTTAVSTKPTTASSTPDNSTTTPTPPTVLSSSSNPTTPSIPTTQSNTTTTTITDQTTTQASTVATPSSGNRESSSIFIGMFLITALRLMNS